MLILSGGMIVIGVLGGCKAFTDSDGQKHYTLTTQAVDVTKSVQATAATVEAISPPGSGLHEVAWVLTSIAGVVMGINEITKKSTASNLNQTVADLIDTLTKAGMVNQPTTSPPKTTTS